MQRGGGRAEWDGVERAGGERTAVGNGEMRDYGDGTQSRPASRGTSTGNQPFGTFMEQSIFRNSWRVRVSRGGKSGMSPKTVR
ncbi:hypothetical protein B0H12DRAFT_1131994 [Mycena haematopus]|nr:hypothetical protein B0H12DRAFT_1131994 [Mycena haematopus]